MISPIVPALYLIACTVCGIMGRKTRLGFIGHFALAVLLTPLVGFVILAVARPLSGTGGGAPADRG
jgi:hypothetical protein